MSKPFIAVCTDHVAHFPAPDRDRSYLKLYPEYCHAIERAGGVPLPLPILPKLAQVMPLLELVQGVMLIGADDYPAEWFGGTTLPTDVPVTPQRAKFDRELIAWLLDSSSLPVLGICGGMQLMAIHSGGTLVQDLPDGPIQHRSGPDGYRRHAIDVKPDSRLAAMLGRTSLEVNSLHHQAVRKVGQGWEATAHAPDGVIEAMEQPGTVPRIGVQWHPERMSQEEMGPLFQAFVQACVQDVTGRRGDAADATLGRTGMA
jgi:putative glutamine amidotransferase